jgi:GNAT superfamily N-acetyltransferase
MTKPEYLSRSATGADVPKVGALVDAAYSHYVEHLGILPRPMTDDYAPVIANQRVTVAESHGTIVGVIVLTVDDEGFLIDNVAVDPSHRGKGLGKALLEFAEAEARRAFRHSSDERNPADVTRRSRSKPGNVHHPGSAKTPEEEQSC